MPFIPPSQEIEDAEYELERLTSIALRAAQIRALEGPAIPAACDELLDASCAAVLGLCAQRMAQIVAGLVEVSAADGWPVADGAAEPGPPVDQAPNDVDAEGAAEPGAPVDQAPNDVDVDVDAAVETGPDTSDVEAVPAVAEAAEVAPARRVRRAS